MTRITVHNDSLQIEIEGLHRLWAFKRRLTIPLAHLQQVSGNPEGIRRPPIGWSVGFWAPGLIVAGTFCSRGRREFWDIRHPTKAIIIDLVNDRYTRLVLEVDAPRFVVDMINEARRRTSSS
ncbi:hypothetical protein [Actinomadura sp. 6N118]|uniref:hypothetical protein n=1 Tax=Actinomadura sp. 6N118 TaxID=3375151 RepID=UPI003795A8C9